MVVLSSGLMRLCQVESPLQEKGVDSLLSCMARTLELALQFVRCDTVTVSTNQINNIIIYNKLYNFRLSLWNLNCEF